MKYFVYAYCGVEFMHFWEDGDQTFHKDEYESFINDRRLTDVKPVSGGYVMGAGEYGFLCYGDASSLGLKSRNLEDGILLGDMIQKMKWSILEEVLERERCLV